ncbi:hypothetical protein [Nitratireductor soli]|uniref:hypothetical protein n=1 Tax=Nitratireductor soli TaxID=1670619 RepID=UPI000B1061D0|nr:hypothetical protein [Nitratireductor soli]
MGSKADEIDVTEEFEKMVSDVNFDVARKGGYYEAYCSYHGIIGQGSPAILQKKIDKHLKKPGPHAIRTLWWDEP